MKTKGKHLHLEPLKILVPLCYGIKARASNQTGSLSPDSLQGSAWWGCAKEMRDHKLIMGSTQRFSSHLKSIIMQTTSVPCCEGLNTNGEQANKHQTERKKTSIFSPLLCFSVTWAWWQHERCWWEGGEAYMQARSMVMSEQNMKKSFIWINH